MRGDVEGSAGLVALEEVGILQLGLGLLVGDVVAGAELASAPCWSTL